MRNACGALLNLSHDWDNVGQEIVEQHGVEMLSQCLEKWRGEEQIQFYVITILSNLFVDPAARVTAWINASDVVDELIYCIQQPDMFKKDSFVSLSDSRGGVQVQSLLCLRNLASDEEFQQFILKRDVLPPLLDNLDSVAAAALLRNLSIAEENEEELIEHGVVEMVLDKFRVEMEGEVKVHLVSILRNLVSNVEGARVFVQTKGLEKIREMLVDARTDPKGEYSCEVQSLMAILALQCRWDLLQSGCLRKLVDLGSGMYTSSVFSNLFASSFTAEEKTRLKEWLKKDDSLERAMDIWKNDEVDTLEFFQQLLTDYQ